MTLGRHSLCCGYSQDAIWRFASPHLRFLGTRSEPQLDTTGRASPWLRQVASAGGLSGSHTAPPRGEDRRELSQRRESTAPVNCEAVRGVQCIWRTAKRSLRPEERRARKEGGSEPGPNHKKILGTHLRSCNFSLKAKAMSRKRTRNVARDTMGEGRVSEVRLDKWPLDLSMDRGSVEGTREPTTIPQPRVFSGRAQLMRRG